MGKVHWIRKQLVMMTYSIVLAISAVLALDNVLDFLLSIEQSILNNNNDRIMKHSNVKTLALNIS